MRALRKPNLPLAMLAAAALVLGCGADRTSGAVADEPGIAAAAEQLGDVVAPTPNVDSGVVERSEATAAGIAVPGDAPAGPEPVLPSDRIPGIVARIDGRDVTRADLLARASEARGALAERGIGAQPTRSFYLKVLDDLIGNALVFRQLDEQGKAASAEEIEAQVAAIRAPFDSDEAFDRVLSERGFDRERLRREVAESITVKRWIDQTILPGIDVTDQEVRAFFDANREQMIEPEKVRARHVLVAAPESASADEKQAARRKIDELRVRVEGGADFATVARESSDDKGSGARGGDLGWFYRGQMVPSFDRAAFALRPGTVSDVVESPFGYHLIEVQERREQTPLEFDQVKDDLRQRIRQHELEQAVRTHLNELGAAAEIEIFL